MTTYDKFTVDYESEGDTHFDTFDTIDQANNFKDALKDDGRYFNISSPYPSDRYGKAKR